LNCSSYVEINGLEKVDYNNTITSDNIGDGRTINYYFDAPPQTVSNLNSAHVTIAWSSSFQLQNSVVIGDGIKIMNSFDSTVSTCNVEGRGISLHESAYGSISECNVSSQYTNINLHGSSRTKVWGNDLWNLYGDGLGVSGQYDDYDCNIGTSNKLNGKSIYYYFNSANVSINNLDAGQIFFAWCSNITLDAGKIIGGGSLVIYESDNISICQYDIIGVRDNRVSYHMQSGIFLGLSEQINISHCNISFFDDTGIMLDNSPNNKITNCSIIMCNRAIYYSHSANNRAFHNNFILNDDEPFDFSGGNYYDNGYPNGGNYWSDYEGNDSFSGPNQNLANSDGIGDTPCLNIYTTTAQRNDGWGVDNYPLMKHKSWETTPPLIYPVTVQRISQSTARIEWETDELSNTRINYSTNSDLSSPSTDFDSEMVTSHIIPFNWSNCRKRP